MQVGGQPLQSSTGAPCSPALSVSLLKCLFKAAEILSLFFYGDASVKYIFKSSS